jgi:hypothetical protein
MPFLPIVGGAARVLHCPADELTAVSFGVRADIGGHR